MDMKYELINDIIFLYNTVLFSDENQSLSFPRKKSHKQKNGISPCQDIYIRSCRHFKITPSTFFYRRLKRPHIDLSHHGIGTDGLKSISIALVVSMS